MTDHTPPTVSVLPVPAPDAPECHPDHARPAQAHTEPPEAPAEDTLPAWLYQRFAVIHGAPPWDRTDDSDRTYWEHHARAVRRAVARGGFKTAPAAVPAADETTR